ncbi:sensor histidine kinase [Actinoplanes solisilvae]|uniref:sensor histidine kinase n=1 Tax=Actinoplanes solisilvae TaxID=2486853 RepID=UPI000FD82339|nr:histidine kinase [Actinoplanes solisilvae]
MRGWRERLVGVVLVAPVVANQTLSRNWGGAAAALAVAAVAVVTARRRPIVAWLIALVGTLADGNFVFALPVLSYLVGLRTERLRAVAWCFAAVAAGGSALNLGLLHVGPSEWFGLAMSLLLLGILPWLVGRYRRQSARLVSAGWERAARLEYERRIVVREARLRERARIAQEMHDSLGHELSLIALGAGALETTPGLAERQQAAAARIRESAATATDQLREIIGVLREPDEEAPLEPAGEHAEALVERFRDAGMTILVARTGELPPAAERTASRIVREGLTNVSRHAPNATVRVGLADDGHRSTITVVNDTGDPTDARPTSGLGLVGLRERVRLAGGTLTAEPTPDGGFRLAAVLPHVAVPVPEEPPVVVELRDARRRARRSLAAAVLTTAGLALVTALGYYPFAVAGAVLDEDTFEHLTVGTPRSQMNLPARQAPGPRKPGCELYSDGNFPLADAAYRLCFTDGRLSGKEHLK